MDIGISKNYLGIIGHPENDIFCIEDNMYRNNQGIRNILNFNLRTKSLVPNLERGSVAGKGVYDALLTSGIILIILI